MKKILYTIVLLCLFSCNTQEKNTMEITLKDNKNIDMSEQNFGQISTQEFKERLDTGDYVVLDVRTPGELPMYGKITQDQLLLDINNPNFPTEIVKLSKQKKYLVYCWHGNRSQMAVAFMKQLGFSVAVDLNGGIEAWRSAGEEVLNGNF